MDSETLHCFPSKDVFDTVNPDMPVVSQESDETNKESLPTTRELMTKQANDLYCWEVANNVGNPWSGYP